MYVYGVGDHGGGPTRRDILRCLRHGRLADLPALPLLHDAGLLRDPREDTADQLAGPRPRAELRVHRLLHLADADQAGQPPRRELLASRPRRRPSSRWRAAGPALPGRRPSARPGSTRSSATSTTSCPARACAPRASTSPACSSRPRPPRDDQDRVAARGGGGGGHVLRRSDRRWAGPVARTGASGPGSGAAPRWRRLRRRPPDGRPPARRRLQPDGLAARRGGADEHLGLGCGRRTARRRPFRRSCARRPVVSGGGRGAGRLLGPPVRGRGLPRLGGRPRLRRVRRSRSRPAAGGTATGATTRRRR